MKIRIGKDKAWYGINRVQEGTKSPAYYVAIKRHGLQLSKHFATSLHGGEEGAFRAAQEWRDRILALLPPMTYRQLRTLVRRNNTSGVPGVWRTEKHSCAYWVATSELGGKKQTRHFNVNEHGEEGARQMAIKARQQMLQAVPDRFWVATEASRDLAVQAFDNSSDSTASDAVMWDDATKERILARLRAEGLIGKPSVSPVQKRYFLSMSGSVWEATHVASDGKRTVRRFSVAKYGEAEAERLAWQAYERLKEEHSPAQLPQQPTRLSEQFNANPDQLLDAVIRKLALKNDAALSRTLGVAPPVISKIRYRRIPVGPSLLVRLLEATQLHIRDLYGLTQAETMREG